MSTPRKKRSTKRPGPVAARRPSAPVIQPAMLSEVRELILTAREQVAQVVDAGLTILYWQIGARIRHDILKEKRAAYGKEIIPELGRQLEAECWPRLRDQKLVPHGAHRRGSPQPGDCVITDDTMVWTHFYHRMDTRTAEETV